MDTIDHNRRMKRGKNTTDMIGQYQPIDTTQPSTSTAPIDQAHGINIHPPILAADDPTNNLPRTVFAVLADDDNSSAAATRIEGVDHSSSSPPAVTDAIYVQIHDALPEAVEMVSINQLEQALMHTRPSSRSDHDDLVHGDSSDSQTRIVIVHREFHTNAEVQPTTELPSSLLSSIAPSRLFAPISCAYYRTVPSEILYLISSYLDGHSLSSLNRVDTASHAVTSKKDLWVNLLQQPWNGSAYLDDYDNGPSKLSLQGVSRPREFYAERYLTACQRRRSLLQAYELHIDEIKREHRSYMCHIINDLLIAPIVLLMLILFTIFLIVQLSRNESLTWFNCWPLIIISSSIIFTSSVLYFKRWCFTSAGFLTSDFYSNSTSLFKHALMKQTNENPYVHTIIWLVSCSVGVLLLTLSLKLTGFLNAQCEWFKVFTPIYVVFFLLFISPLFGFVSVEVTWRGRLSTWLISWLVCLGPLLAFTLLLNLHLDEYVTLRVIDLFIPLFVLDLFVLLMMWTYLFKPVEADTDECWYYLVVTFKSFVIWFCLYGPFVVFKILLTLRLDGMALVDTSWSNIFLPLYPTLIGLLLESGISVVRQLKDFSQPWSQFPPRPILPQPDK